MPNGHENCGGRQQAAAGIPQAPTPRARPRREKAYGKPKKRERSAALEARAPPLSALAPAEREKPTVGKLCPTTEEGGRALHREKRSPPERRGVGLP